MNKRSGIVREKEIEREIHAHTHAPTHRKERVSFFNNHLWLFVNVNIIINSISNFERSRKPEHARALKTIKK